MQFSPKTMALYTDAGELVKVLHCPRRMTWDQLGIQTADPHRMCAECEKTVLDTSGMTETEVVAAVRADPSTCLKVSATQANVTILEGHPSRR